MRAPLFRLASLFACLAVVSFAFVTLRGPRGIPALVEKNHQIELLEQSNATLAKEIERKRERVRRLSENPAEQELEIRQRLKLVHPGEKVYIVGDPDKN